MARKRSPRAKPKMTAKQERFVQEYLLDLNATQAAIRAGYKAHAACATASENLRKPLIAEAIGAVQAQRSAKFSIGLDNVLIELARLAFSNMQDYSAAIDSGDLASLTREQAAAIQEVTTESYMVGKGDEAREVRRVKLKLAEKRGPLTDLCKHLGGFIERFAAVNPDGTPVQPPDASDNDLPRRIAFALSKGLRARTVLSEKDPMTH